MKTTFSLNMLLRSLIMAGLVVTPFSSMQVMADDEVQTDEEPVITCYAVADNSQNADSLDMLALMDMERGFDSVVGLTGTGNMEAITFDFDPKNPTLYAANAGQFGTLNLDPNRVIEGRTIPVGEFIPIGDGFGVGDGEEGKIHFTDVDSLTVDISTGKLFGTHRREFFDPPRYDLLFKIDPLTGKHISDAFGNDIDYVVIKVKDDSGELSNKFDIDDLAMDPRDNTLYGVANEGTGMGSVLVKIDKLTGEATIVGSNVNDIESLDFVIEDANTAKLIGTTGRGHSQGAAGDATRNRLYEIDIATGLAAEIGEMGPASGGDPEQDYEAVSCTSNGIDGRKPSCVMYAVHDEGLNDSQIIEINPFALDGVGNVRPLGPMHHTLDIEGLAILDTVLYGSSGASGGGNVSSNYGPDGMIYQIDRATGEVTELGLTGLSEISGFALNPVDGTLWGWARGVMDPAGAKRVGPVIIDPVTPANTQLVTIFPFKDPDIEALAWSNDGTKLYAAANRELWVYDKASQELTLKCSNIVNAEVEALEMQPNNLLLLGVDGNKTLGIIAYDPENCEAVASRMFTNLPYDDIESIEWPAAECAGQSWLYADSGNVDINLVGYDDVADEVKDALAEALNNLGINNGVIEELHGGLNVYIDDGVFRVLPEDVNVRSGRDGDREEGAVVEARLTENTDGGLVLEFGDDTGRQFVFNLRPIIDDTDALTKTLGQFGTVTLLPSNDIELVMVGDAAQTTIIATPDVAVIPAIIPEGQALEIPAVQIADLEEVEDVNGDGINDYVVTYPKGSTQYLFIKSIVNEAL
jgi:DNA-binding beta-propeller fold protein YncE